MADVEEEKPGPDLDELLELLASEPEEKPRRRGTPGWLWLTLGVVLSLGGVWLAFVTAKGGATEKKGPGPPVLPTKVSDRKPREEQEIVADVVEDYIARCKKGMTGQQVRWVIEDFQHAGLDQGLRSVPSEDFIRQRKAQHAWYLDLLADGLRLDPGQRQAAREKLAGLLEEAVASFQKDLGEQAGEPFEQNGRRLQVVDGAVVRRLIDGQQWLTDGRYAPWELCELTEEQKRVTYLGYLTHYPEEPGTWFSPDGFGLTNAEDEDEGNIGDFPTGQAPDIGEAGAIFPFYSLQGFIEGPEEEGRVVSLGKQAMRCHPAQLKTLLLLKPDTVSRLLGSLDAPEK